MTILELDLENDMTARLVAVMAINTYNYAGKFDQANEIAGKLKSVDPNLVKQYRVASVTFNEYATHFHGSDGSFFTMREQTSPENRQLLASGQRPISVELVRAGNSFAITNRWEWEDDSGSV